jgi:hypothetical protein
MAAVAQPVQPAGEQDRETAISIDVVGEPYRASGDGYDPVVERCDQILQQLDIHLADIFSGHVHLNPLSDRAENSPDGKVIARAGNVSIADHQREVTLPGRHSAGGVLDRLCVVRAKPWWKLDGCLLLFRNFCTRGRNRLQPDRKRSSGPRK